MDCNDEILQIQHFTQQLVEHPEDVEEEHWGKPASLTGVVDWLDWLDGVGWCWSCLSWPGHWPSSSPAPQLEPWCSVLCSQPPDHTPHTTPLPGLPGRATTSSCNAGLSKINEQDFTGFKWDILSWNEWVEQVSGGGATITMPHTGYYNYIVQSTNLSKTEGKKHTAINTL